MYSFKGLVVDLEDGNLVKLADDGTVLRYIAIGLLSHTYCALEIFMFFENMLFFLIWPARHMEPVNLAQKRLSNIMDQKGSGNTSTTLTHPSPDLVECHCFGSAILICIMFINLNLSFDFNNWLLLCF